MNVTAEVRSLLCDIADAPKSSKVCVILGILPPTYMYPRIEVGIEWLRARNFEIISLED